jgi:putative MATE family efflux protein
MATIYQTINRCIAFVKASLSSEEHDFTTGSLKKAVFLLAIPMILEMSIESVFALVDIFFVSKLGSAAIDTVGLTESAMTIIYSIAFGVGMATTSMVARRVGEKNTEGAAKSAAQSIILAISISIIITFIGIFFSKQLLHILGASHEVVLYGHRFTQILLVGNGVIMLLHLMNGIFRGAGNAAIAMKSLWLANICNIILCPILIHYYGITGAAIATTTGRGIGILYQLYQLLKGKGMIQIHFPHFKPNKELLQNLLSIASTATLQFIVASASWIVMAMLMARIGEKEMAGYTIAIRLIVFFILPAFGFSNAAATLVGQNLGAKQPERAEQSVWLVAKYNAVFMGTVSLFFLLGAPLFIQFFTKEEAIVHTGVLALRVISIGYVFYGIGMTMMNAYNGAGDSKTPTLVNLFWFWAFQIPLAYLTAIVLEWGSIGVFSCIVITETCITLTSVYLFRKGKWKTVKI